MFSKFDMYIKYVSMIMKYLITHCRPPHCTARKDHSTLIVTIHLQDNNSKATCFKNSEYDLEISQSQTAEKPMAFKPE